MEFPKKAATNERYQATGSTMTLPEILWHAKIDIKITFVIVTQHNGALLLSLRPATAHIKVTMLQDFFLEAIYTLQDGDALTFVAFLCHTVMIHFAFQRLRSSGAVFLHLKLQVPLSKAGHLSVLCRV